MSAPRFISSSRHNIKSLYLYHLYFSDNSNAGHWQLLNVANLWTFDIVTDHFFNAPKIIFIDKAKFNKAKREEKT